MKSLPGYTDRLSFGCETPGKLRSVMLHNPGGSLNIINSNNYKIWLFNAVPDVRGYIREHMSYRELLASKGVNVYELSEYVCENGVLMSMLPNLAYIQDTAVIASKGAILSRMALRGRRDEEVVVKEALGNLGIPLLSEFDDPQDHFEGCLLLSPETVLVCATERHSYYSVWKFLLRTVKEFKEVLYVNLPKERRFMHPSTVYGRISNRLSMAFLPAFSETFLFTENGSKKINFESFMKEKEVEIIDVSDSEQRNLACSFVLLEEGVMLHYDTALSRKTLRRLSSRGVETLFFHPRALLSGGGSLRCLTLELYREPEEKGQTKGG